MGSNTMLPQHSLISQPGLHSNSVIPAIPRVSRLRPARILRHPLVIYSAFVTISLLLLGGMAVASLPH
jgi:hypothetical protein